jgi:hypothetical protein
MPTLLIAYDLASSGQNAIPLAATIRQLGSRWARPLASLWYLETSATAAEIEATLVPLLGDDDGLLVQEVTGHAALANTMLRWTCGSALVTMPPVNQPRPWQPRLVTGLVTGLGPRCAVGPVLAGEHLPSLKTEVAVAA